MSWFKNGNLIEEKTLIKVMDAYEKGMLKLPLYQRNVVWSEERMCALWDSLLRGFPLPSFLLIRGKGNGQSREIQTLPHITGRSASDMPKEYFDLLDGQQRMAAIILGYKSEGATTRLWLDLAPDETADHPFKFRYWIHACTRVFPFGFRMTASGEHDFSALPDNEISDLWKKLQKTELKEKEFYELPLEKTCPYKAGCPVPLDELVKLWSLPEQQFEKTIIDCAENYLKTMEQFLEAPQKPKDRMVELVANGILHLSQQKLAFQLVNFDFDKTGEDDEYILFERIGRGGVQISQRQLAVSKLMIELGQEGNDAVAKFQSSEKLQHLLETEDIIHGLARVAFSVTMQASKATPETETETEENKNKRDMLELTPIRLKTIFKNTEIRDEFLGHLKRYCADSDNSISRLQVAFENLYSALLFDKTDNPNGFSLVQLAQPHKDGEGIAPITLHPLLYLYLEKNLMPDREDMLRWVLFANGFVNDPANAKLNREVFEIVRRSNKVDFSAIKEFVFSEDQLQLRKDLGFSWNKPVYDKGKKEIIWIEETSIDVPTPDQITEISLRRVILGDWWSSYSRLTWFMLLWNQREAMEDLYGKIEYMPALFSKGRPFDADHIVARNRFLRNSKYSIQGLSKDVIRKGIELLVSVSKDFEPFSNLTDISDNSIRFSEDNFRKGFPNHPANFRYWPKRLNRSDGFNGVANKMQLEQVQRTMEGHPLSKIFDIISEKELWYWSAIPIQDMDKWMQLPPDNDVWDENIVRDFILSIFKREHFLYSNAYNFVME